MEDIKTLYVNEVKNDCGEYYEEYELYYGLEYTEPSRIANYQELMYLASADDEISSLHKVKIDDGVYKYYEVWDYDELVDDIVIVDLGYIKVE